MNEKQKRLTLESIRRPMMGSNQQVPVAGYQAVFDLAYALLADPMPREELSQKISDIIYDDVCWDCAGGKNGGCLILTTPSLGAVRRVVNALLDGMEIK